MRYIILVIYLMVCFNLYGQINLKTDLIIIVDSNTKQPINFPHIIFKDSTMLYGNYGGEILSSEILNRQIKIQSIGYFEKELFVTKQIDSIFLDPKTYDLPQITIKPRMYKDTIIGSYTKKLKRSTFIPFIGSKIVFYIAGEGNSGTIKELILPIKKPEKNKYVRVLLLERNDDEKPGESIIEEDILFESTKVPKSIDLKKYNLQMPNQGIFVGLEWLSDEFPNSFITAKSPYILANWTSKKCNTFQLLPKNNEKWHVIDFKDEKGKCLNIAVGLKIEK